jgi:hypothetical protein
MSEGRRVMHTRERGQVWRYQGGAYYYWLGYVFIQRYYEPTLFRPFVEIRVYSSAGRLPDSGWMCDDELLRGRATRGLLEKLQVRD